MRPSRFPRNLGRMLLACIVAVVATPACAAFWACNGPASGIVGFVPGAPTSSDPVTITVSESQFLAQSISAQVTGAVVDVTYVGLEFNLHPGPGPVCASTTVAALAPGNYTVRYFRQYTQPAGSPPTLQATAPLTVVPQIPAVAPAALLALAAVVGGCGVAVLRRRRNGTHKAH